METVISFANILEKLNIFFSKFLGVNWLFIMYVIFSIITILLVIVISYSLVRLYEFKKEDEKKEKKENKKLKEEEKSKEALNVSQTKESKESSVNLVADDGTWKRIRDKLLSDSESDWRIAILEADIYLDKILDKKGYYGDTLGDKLKSLTPSDLPSLQIAWEAHKVRNQIAHNSDYILTMPEARRVLSYFEIVFRDLEVIE